MKLLYGVSAAAILAALALPAAAQTAPSRTEQVARPELKADLPQLALVKVADGFNDPTGVTMPDDGSGRIFVVERVGRIRVVDKNGKVQNEPFLDLTKINPLGSDVQTGFVEQGLFSVAFDPKFKENGYFYVHYTSLPFNGDRMIVRFKAEPGATHLTAEQANATARVIMRIEQPWYNHNGGQLAFGPKDGYLYISSGDGGWEGDPMQTGQDLSTKLGKILRIDVNVPDDYAMPYRIPKDNPFAGASKEQLMKLFGVTEEQFAKIRTKAMPEIWAYGLRNPYSFSFDSDSGDLYIADVGQNHWEEINFQPGSSKGGENYGWSRMEGSFCHPMVGALEQKDGRFITQKDCVSVGVLPAAEYPHETPYPEAKPLKTSFGCSVQGFGVGNFQGKKAYLAGDWCSGRLWALSWDGQGNKWKLAEALQSDLQFTSGTRGADGNVYAVNCNCFYLADKGPTQNPPGALWRIVPADQVATGAETARVRAPAQRAD